MNALHLKNVLSAAELEQVRSALASQTFAAGAATAAPIARSAKHNTEILASTAELAPLAQLVERGLRKHPYFQAWTLPRRLTTVLFNRYDEGMYYGNHVDGGIGEARPGFIRMDLAVTVFLSEPAEYDGGELVIEATTEQQSIKLPAGDAVVYPATTIHRVEKVTRGTRAAAVCWVESAVRAAPQRELLFDLRVLTEQLVARRADPESLVLLEKCHANLLRMWAEV